MKLTIKELKLMKACKDGIEWYEKYQQDTLQKTLEQTDNNSIKYFSWYIAKKLNIINKVHYAIYAAEQVIDIYEKKYPADSRPRKAIEAAKTWTKNPAADAADAAAAAAAAAGDAGDAAAADAGDDAFAAAAAAAAAGDAGAAAAYSDDDAFAAAYADDADDAGAAAAAAAAGDDARYNMRKKIIVNGLILLHNQEAQK